MTLNLVLNTPKRERSPRFRASAQAGVIHWKYAPWGGMPISKLYEDSAISEEEFSDRELDYMHAVIDECLAMEPWELNAKVQELLV